jgi:GT2 family glycosyltransferase
MTAGTDSAALPVSAAPPVSAGIDPSRTPISVVEFDLDRGRMAPPTGVGRGGPVGAGPVFGLVRWHGRPLGVAQGELDGTAEATASLLAAVRREFADRIAAREAAGNTATPCSIPAQRSMPAPQVSVIVATRERPRSLARCLDSLLRLDYSNVEIIVVDNAASTTATAELVHGRYGDQVRYIAEPVPGLACAHNRGLTIATGEILAFTDDDVVADARWANGLVEAFQAYPRAGCVTGLIMPAELETRAQAMLERRGAFAKGFDVVEHHRSAPPHPLFPFTAGRLGSGANMAFTARALRELGGFDPALGTGTEARGGDDLLAFFRCAAAGHSVVYQPDALVWHHHRGEEDALAKQALGYGVGLGAYLTAALVHEPRMVPALIRRLPRGLAYARRDSAPDEQDPQAWPAALARLERRGLLSGPAAYARSRWHARARVRGTQPKGN